MANQYRWCSAAWFERTVSPAIVKTIYSFETDKLNIHDDFQLWSALTLDVECRDKSRPTKAVTSYRTPYFAPLIWSALTCQRFGKRRLVAARLVLS
jgi:hypothetical protein